jgi:hypothetical protein
MLQFCSNVGDLIELGAEIESSQTAAPTETQSPVAAAVPPSHIAFQVPLIPQCTQLITAKAELT